MDQLLQIFTQLGVDQSIFYQFGLFCILFLVLKSVLFDRLLFVLEVREAKTTKLESSAKAKLDEANRLATEYNSQIESFNQELQKRLTESKKEIDKKQADAIKKEEAVLSKDFAEKKSQLVEQMSAQGKKVMHGADELSRELVRKLSA